MGFVQVSKDEGIVTLTLTRGKVNALNEPMVEELKRMPNQSFIAGLCIR